MYYYYYYVVSENGVTPAGFNRLEEEHFEGLGLSIIGKKLVQKALKEPHTKVQILLMTRALCSTYPACCICILYRDNIDKTCMCGCAHEQKARGEL